MIRLVTSQIEGQRAQLAQLRLAPEGGLRDLEMTPLAILDVIGVEPPSFPALPYLPEGMATLTAAEVAQQGLHAGWGTCTTPKINVSARPLGLFSCLRRPRTRQPVLFEHVPLQR